MLTPWPRIRSITMKPDHTVPSLFFGIALAGQTGGTTSAASVPEYSSPPIMPTYSSYTLPRCGPGLSLCQVIDPTRSQAPWHHSTDAWPQCYDPTRYTCLSNFLCPTDAPKISGEYACGSTHSLQRLGEHVNIVINAPGTGDIDGVKGFNFIIDVTMEVENSAFNGDIPFKPLYQDSNSSTFGPGPNAAFPGFVVLQNTTADKGVFGGPETNLAGLFQLNGVAAVNGRSQYNTVWNAGAPLFGIGPSEIVIYYVTGQAAKKMPLMPDAVEGLISNVASVAFSISNRTTIAVPPVVPRCTNNATYVPNNTTTSENTPQVSAQIFHPLSGDVVGVNGSGWILDLLFDANAIAANVLISGQSGYRSGFVNQSSPNFKPGTNSLLPGLVVLMNTTVNTGAFKGPGTNLAGLFQINNLRTVNCDTIIEIWAEWLVGKPIAGHGPSQIRAFLVNGTAPALVNDIPNLVNHLDVISDIATVDIVLS